MKKLLLSTAVLLLFILDGSSQATFNTGALRVDVNQYGRIRLFTPAGVRQLQRASILVGTSSTSVFDYTNDSDELDPTVLVASPSMSDFEIYGSFDNGFSSLPPAVVVKLNAYGWTNAGYTIVKFNVKSDEASSINASIGLEIIPEINQTYGFDSVTYNTSAGVIRFHRGTQINMGMKLLSASLSSLYSFEWYDGYTADTSLWNWMNYGSLQPLYASGTADGPVSITAQSPVALANGQSFTVYYAMALGADEAAMLANISAAALKYQSLIVSVNDLESSVNGFHLGKNHPNPFKQSTTINYRLTDDGYVSLKIYDVLGNEVASLVNSNQTKGSYTIPFNANGLPDGMYSYTLRCGNQVRSNKMLLVK
jgi:hypothetical protein